MQDQAGRVRSYYDKNTSWMLLFGQGRGEAAIHRPVWLLGERLRRQALHAVDRLVADALAAPAAAEGAGVIAARKCGTAGGGGDGSGGDGRGGNGRVGDGRRIIEVLDLGSGAGGSALWLAEHHAVRVTGVTLSPVQAERARRLALRRGLSERCRFLVADFTCLPRLEGIAAAYAVESFTHGSDPDAFFSQVGGLLPRGGRLILCDDFLPCGETPGGGRRSADRRNRWLSRFRAGWRLPSLMAAERAIDLAAKRGFRLLHRKNLTPHLRPTPLLLSIPQRLLGAAMKRTAWGSSLYGGSALQVCQQNGWTEYLFLVLERR
jgi:tocopherol O-methyltransferase